MKNLGWTLAPMLAAGLLVALGCREDAESPTAPEVTPALSTASAPLSFRQVSAGAYHTCGVTFDNRAYCWGESALGALGNGDKSGLHFSAVITGSHGNHTCAVTPGDRAYCWGRNSSGQLGDGTETRRLVPVAVLGP
jgi:alpha-tubulin suppressor-like RCC1 family protein